MNVLSLKRLGRVTAFMFATSLFVAFMAILLNHFWEEYRIARSMPDILEAKAVRAFYLILSDVDSWREGPPANLRPAVALPLSARCAWDLYLKVSASRDWSDIAGYTIKEGDRVTLFTARVRGSNVEAIAVATPRDEKHASNYVVIGYVNCSRHRRGRLTLLAYSPSRPDRIFAAPADVDCDIVGVLTTAVASYDWSEPFDPPEAAWPGWYSVEGGGMVSRGSEK